MKPALTLIGIIALAMGLLWMGQGSGYIPWPASSFMINQTRWIYYGAAPDCFVAEPVIGPATSGRTRWLLAMTAN